MKVLNPGNTTHEIKLIYRRELSGSVVFTLTNEVTKESETLVLNSSVTTDGITTVNFDKTVLNRSKYILKVADEEGVVYRCKIFSTDQTPQNYDKTKGYLVYE